MPPLAVPAPWQDLPVTPARIRWRVRRGGRTVRPWHTPIDFTAGLLPQDGLPPDLRARHPAEPPREARPLPLLPRPHLEHDGPPRRRSTGSRWKPPTSGATRDPGAALRDRQRRLDRGVLDGWLECDERRGRDRGGVDAVLGVDLGLAAGLAEAVDAERDAARRRARSRRTRARGSAPSMTVTTGALARRGNEPLEVRRRGRGRRAAARCGLPASRGTAGRATRGRARSPRRLPRRRELGGLERLGHDRAAGGEEHAVVARRRPRAAGSRRRRRPPAAAPRRRARRRRRRAPGRRASSRAAGRAPRRPASCIRASASSRSHSSSRAKHGSAYVSPGSRSDPGRRERLVRAALARERDPGRRAREDEARSRVGRVDDSLERPHHERVVERADREQALALVVPASGRAGRAAARGSSRRSPSRCAGPCGPTRHFSGESSIASYTGSSSGPQTPVLLMKPPRFVETETSGETVTRRSPRPSTRDRSSSMRPKAAIGGAALFLVQFVCLRPHAARTVPCQRCRRAPRHRRADVSHSTNLGGFINKTGMWGPDQELAYDPMDDSPLKWRVGPRASTSRSGSRK